MHTPYSQSSGHTSPEVKEVPITRIPHPTTGEVYTDVNLGKKKKTEQVETGPTYYQVHIYTLTSLPSATDTGS